MAVPAVWLVRKAGGSLLPTAVLYAAVPAGMVVAGISSNYGILGRADEVYPGCIVAAAVLFALGGRMWRRTSAPASPLAPDEPSPLAGSYDVVARDMSMRRCDEAEPGGARLHPTGS